MPVRYVLLSFMTCSPPLSAVDRFALALDALVRAVAARIAARVMTGAMILLVCRRIRRVELQIKGLLARFTAGRLQVVAAPRSGGGGGGARATAGRLPSGFAWLLPLVPAEAACFAGQLRGVLAEPEMVALLEASPQARRVLRPLCRMLGIEGSVLGDLPKRTVEPAEGAVRTPRIRRARVPVDLGRIPLPRGVLAAARRDGFGRR
jgi:hypothetical protein